MKNHSANQMIKTLLHTSTDKHRQGGMDIIFTNQKKAIKSIVCKKLRTKHMDQERAQLKSKFCHF